MSELNKNNESAPILLKKIALNNLLSFGPEESFIPMNMLNVLIGPNGVGKSNLIEAISLLQAAPTALSAPIRKGGGVKDWIWKGEPLASSTTMLVVVSKEIMQSKHDLGYLCEFSRNNQRFHLEQERIGTYYSKHTDLSEEDQFNYYWFDGKKASIRSKKKSISLNLLDLDLEASILSQRKEPLQYPELTLLGRHFEQIRIYREWDFGRKALLRLPQSADAPNHFLAEDCTNLGLILNSFRTQPRVKRMVLESLKELYEGIDDFDVLVEGGTVQFFLQEGDYTIPATRLSDGTIRYLCLLAILCHPDPPPLVCIEEPELGMHTDMMPVIARLLKEASKRMQLIVTTHSEALVDALSDTPESVLVCEKHDGATKMRRLDPEALKVWLEKYSLGQLWRKGEIGGNRW